jgi:hypothetical protein
MGLFKLKVDTWTIALALVAVGLMGMLMGLAVWGAIGWPPRALATHPLPLLLFTALITVEAFKESRVKKPEDLAKNTFAAAELVLIVLSVIGVFVLASTAVIAGSTASFIALLYVANGFTFIVETFR